jgi:hypothetical protein
MRRPSLAHRALAGALLLGLLLPLAAAHGHDEDANMGMAMGMSMSMAEPAAPSPSATAEPAPPNYFTHPEHRGLMYAHIGLMTLAWVFVLPVGECP